ncbi:hypothetical protein [Salicibibacter kimchii]|uniref:DUF4352 domain-containing protein n=1 Tax=Salicibibacter kimchii TaxID=2099786 RepID=A0A345BUX1_9BACI|nr:hypothetical protein [Salicibibacter kimchii]AXF54752.1 hypothetical protein DT065_01100 [Salicibibacter kimchii]
MKKYIVAIGLGSMLVLAACGGGGESESESNGDNGGDAEATEESGEQASAEADEGEAEAEEEETSTDDDASESESANADTSEGDGDITEGGNEVGETVTNDAGETTLVSLNDDIDTIESGPITLDIEKVNGASATFDDEMAVEMFGEESEYIQLDMTVENTSEDDVTFYASQATMITDTGEQLEPEMMASDHIEGEFLGQVEKSGTSIYMLENSTADEVESVELRFDAPHDQDWEDVGESIETEIDLEQ